jgi:hypothetical protein
MIEQLLQELPSVIRMEKPWILKLTKLFNWDWRVSYVSWFWDELVTAEWKLEDALKTMLEFTKNLKN